MERHEMRIDGDFIVCEHRAVGMNAVALFSRCERYRYVLCREWDPKARHMIFLMLNPSTATHEILDPTVRGCLQRAIAWGYGGLTVLNLFAFRSTDPKGLLSIEDPIGPENDDVIRAGARRLKLASGTLICGWGSNKAIGPRASGVLGILRQEGVTPHALAINKNGSPKHPLYVAHATRPKVMQ